MDATALTLSSPVIQVHAAAALLALVVGTIVLLMEKGTPLHKRMGRLWAGLMVVVAASSFLITEIRMFGPYSWIHVLSIYTFIGLAQAIWFIRRGNVRAHKATMIGLYVGALLTAGGFTLLPGRRMHAVLFADGGQSAAIVAILIAVTLGTVLVVRRRRSVARQA